MGDPLVECVDVDRGSEPGLAPGLFAEGLGQSFFQVLDSGVEPDGAFVGGEEVGLQRVDLLQQVAVPVENARSTPATRAR